MKSDTVSTPDGLDMLITTRNHDLKVAVAQQARPADWIHALVSLQTMEGFSGPTWYGASRMNGGSSSRAMLTLAPALPDGKTVHPSRWWQRDTRRLLADRSGVRGIALVWLKDWPDGMQLRVGEDLDPLYIEICRRIRISQNEGRLQATKAGSKAARIINVNGMTDDPWAPTNIAKPRSFTLGHSGEFSYVRLCDLLYSGGWTPAPLCKPAEGDSQDMLLVPEAFARGNSKTGGFRSRVVPISRSVVKGLLGEIATDQSALLIEDIRRIDRALRNGLALIAANGLRDAVGPDHYARTRAGRARLDQEADAMFFPVLWRMLDAPSSEARLQIRAQFMQDLAERARRIFREALPAIPSTAVFRPRAKARATAQLDRGLHLALKDSGLIDHLPDLNQKEPEHG